MAEGKKGRKAGSGTYEAREFVVGDKFKNWLDEAPVTQEAKERIKKAIHYGLCIKSLKVEKVEEKEKVEVPTTVVESEITDTIITSEE